MHSIFLKSWMPPTVGPMEILLLSFLFCDSWRVLQAAISVTHRHPCVASPHTSPVHSTYSYYKLQVSLDNLTYTITRKIPSSGWSGPLGLLCWKCFTWAIRRRRPQLEINLNIVLQPIVLLWACGKNTDISSAGGELTLTCLCLPILIDF